MSITLIQGNSKREGGSGSNFILIYFKKSKKKIDNFRYRLTEKVEEK